MKLISLVGMKKGQFCRLRERTSFSMIRRSTSRELPYQQVSCPDLMHPMTQLFRRPIDLHHRRPAERSAFWLPFSPDRRYSVMVLLGGLVKMSWVNDLASGLGIPAGAATVAVAMYAACAAAEKAA